MVNHRLLKGLVMVALCTGGSIAQNARINALGGCTIIDDMISIGARPADMNDYEDAVQGTYAAANAAVGPFVGVKEMGSLLSLGVYYDGGNILNAPLYSTLNSALSLDANLPPALDVDPIPRLLVGLDLNGISIGAALYFERAFYRFDLTDEAPGTKSLQEVKGTFINPGILLGVNLGESVLPLSITAGLSVPYLSGKAVEEDPGTDTTEYKVHSRGAISGTAGVEAVLDVYDLDWTIGVTGNVLSYGRIKVDGTENNPNPLATNPDTVYNFETGLKYLTVNAGIYTGVEKELVARNILLGAMIGGNMTFDRIKPDFYTLANYDPGRVTDLLLELDANAGVEKEWAALRHLDALQLRCGAAYSASVLIEREKGDTAEYSHDQRLQNVADHDGFTGTIGMGLSKGIFQFDFQMQPGALVNLFKLSNGTTVANDFASATITLDFKRPTGTGGAATVSEEPPMLPPPSFETPSTDEQPSSGSEEETDEETFGF